MWLDGSSLLWFHPLAFVLFVFISASLTALGVLVYWASLVFIAKSRQVSRTQKAPNHIYLQFAVSPQIKVMESTSSGDFGHCVFCPFLPHWMR